MKLIFLGPARRRQGHAGDWVSARSLNVPHISTGDMFRSAVRNEPDQNRPGSASSYMDDGQLVPDSVAH